MGFGCLWLELAKIGLSGRLTGGWCLWGGFWSDDLRKTSELCLVWMFVCFFGTVQ